MKIYIVNSFTSNNSGGNPAGVVLDGNKLSDEQMQKIAKEVDLSETAFVLDSNNADKKIRFFTTNQEVGLCGHATIAAWHLFKKKYLLDNGKYTQETLAGKLEVKIEESKVYMQQSEAKFYKTIPARKICKSLNISKKDLDNMLKPQIVSTGLRDLLIPIKKQTNFK